MVSSLLPNFIIHNPLIREGKVSNVYIAYFVSDLIQPRNSTLTFRHKVSISIRILQFI